MSKLRKLNLDNQADNEELEQYGRRFVSVLAVFC